MNSGRFMGFVHTNLGAIERLSGLHVSEHGVAHHHRVDFVVRAGRDHQVRVSGEALDHLHTLDVRLEGLHGLELFVVVGRE